MVSIDINIYIQNTLKIGAVVKYSNSRERGNHGAISESSCRGLPVTSAMKNRQRKEVTEAILHWTEQASLQQGIKTNESPKRLFAQQKLQKSPSRSSIKPKRVPRPEYLVTLSPSLLSSGTRNCSFQAA